MRPQAGQQCSVVPHTGAWIETPEEHLTFENHRDILIIVQQMAKFHLFF